MFGVNDLRNNTGYEIYYEDYQIEDVSNYTLGPRAEFYKIEFSEEKDEHYFSILN